jgi:hypothetical protein
MSKEITWSNELVPVSKLQGYKANPREITKDNLARLKRSLKKYSQVKPLLCDKDYTVIGGNQRLSLFEKGEVWVRVPHRKLTADEVKKMAIVHNNKIGDWDFDKLGSLGFEDDTLVDVFGFDQELINELGFDFDDLDFDDMDEDRVIKKLLVSFPKDVDVEAMTKRITTKLQVETFEEALLILIQRYEDNQS